MNPPEPKILVVDDEAEQLRALCETLRDHGYHTTGAPTAQAALAALSKGSFDVLVTDLMMPGMDGIELVGEARALHPELACILMTGEGSIRSAVNAMKAGALDFILKPFELSVLLPVLARAVTIRQLQRDNRVLEDHVKARTEQLEMANKELEAFSYSVAHDLRAPIRAVDAFSAMLLTEAGGRLSEHERGLVLRIGAGARRMAGMVEGLLSLSRIGRQSIRKSVVRVESIVRESVEELRRTSSPRYVEVVWDRLPDCLGDESLVKQAFFNLLSNAFKYTGKVDHPVIRISFEAAAGEGIYSVRDNGVGFDMRYEGRLFGVFQRLHDPGDFEGMGVGLSIVQRIVHRHGGRIWAEGEVGKGAAFHFTLPGG